MQNLHLFNKFFKQMKRTLLRLLPVAVVLLTASCTDDNYDLSEVDTTSQFTVKDLVVPLNMAPIKLDAIIAIDEDDDIKKDKNGNYYFEKVGEKKKKADGSYEEYCFKSEDVKVEKITIKKPADISQNVTVAITLSDAVRSNWETYAADKTIAQIMADGTLKSQVGIDDEVEVFSVSVDDTKDFNMNAVDIDSRITKLAELGIDPLSLNIDIKLEGLKSVVTGVPITGLTIALPCGMTVESITDGGSYGDKGVMSFPTLVIDGQKNIKAIVTALKYSKTKEDAETYKAMADDGAKFDANAHTFEYNKVCTVGGSATIKVKDLKGTATLTDIKNAEAASYSCNVSFSNDLVVNKFSGGINYEFEDDINIDPVQITHDDLPELFINDVTGEEVNIILDNPQLYLDIKNPFCGNNIGNVKTPLVLKLSITGNDTYTHDISLKMEQNNIMLSRNKRSGLKYSSGYTWEDFNSLANILSGDKIPEELKINVEKPVLKFDDVINFELGKELEGITGNWLFYSQLALSTESVIKYIKEWDDWQSDDLDGLTVTAATVSFNLTKNVALNARKIEFTLLGKDGKTLKGSTAILADAKEEFKEIILEGEPLSNITGGKLFVNLTGKNQSINKDQEIIVSNLRLKVDGYYDKDF